MTTRTPTPTPISEGIENMVDKAKYLARNSKQPFRPDELLTKEGYEGTMAVVKEYYKYAPDSHEDGCNACKLIFESLTPTARAGMKDWETIAFLLERYKILDFFGHEELFFDGYYASHDSEVYDIAFSCVREHLSAEADGSKRLTEHFVKYELPMAFAENGILVELKFLRLLLTENDVSRNINTTTETPVAPPTNPQVGRAPSEPAPVAFPFFADGVTEAKSRIAGKLPFQVAPAIKGFSDGPSFVTRNQSKPASHVTQYLPGDYAKAVKIICFYNDQEADPSRRVSLIKARYGTDFGAMKIWNDIKKYVARMTAIPAVASDDGNDIIFISKGAVKYRMPNDLVEIYNLSSDLIRKHQVVSLDKSFINKTLFVGLMETHRVVVTPKILWELIDPSDPKEATMAISNDCRSLNASKAGPFAKPCAKETTEVNSTSKATITTTISSDVANCFTVVKVVIAQNRDTTSTEERVSWLKKTRERLRKSRLRLEPKKTNTEDSAGDSRPTPRNILSFNSTVIAAGL